MAKVALLVEFNPRTRVVVDIPDGVSVDTFMENNENFSKITEAAREQMLENGIRDYLSGENMWWEEDNECPFGTFNGEE